MIPHVPGITGPERRPDPLDKEDEDGGDDSLRRRRRRRSLDRLPPCREIARMDDIIAAHGLLMRPAGIIHVHRGSDKHRANTCCCAFEREVTARRLRMAREAGTVTRATLVRGFCIKRHSICE